MSEPHDVRHDTAGWGGHVRLTCYSEGCNGATLDSQPWMGQEVFDGKVTLFMDAHPCEIVRCVDHGGRTLRWNGRGMEVVQP